MGYWKYALLSAVTVFAFTSFVACNENKNQQLKSGSVVSDGVNVTSQGTLAGYQLNVAITNIGPGAGSYNQGYNVSQQYGGTANSQHFDILITGGQAAWGAQPASITVTPSIYNPAYTQWYGQVSTMSYPISTTSGYQFQYEGKCTSQACEVLYLNVIVSYNNEAKQIGIKKSMTLNRILAVTEHVVNVQGVLSTDQLITELNGKSSL